MSSAELLDEHWHHDFRHTSSTQAEAMQHQADAVNGAGWFALDAPAAGHITRALGNALGKLRQLVFIE